MYSKTTLQAFVERAQEQPDKPFLHQPFGERWEMYTWSETDVIARKLASYLRSLKLREGAHIGIVSKNCREWIITDIAISMAGYVSVPFFPNLTADQIAEVLDLGDVDALFVGKLENWTNRMEHGVAKDLPIIASPPYEDNDPIKRGKPWNDIMAEYPPLAEVIHRSGDDLWTLIFTSGTTGTPKGVMLSINTQIALMSNLYESNPLDNDYDGNNRYFSFLPLNHVAERGTVETMCLTHGGEIFFAESIQRFPDNLRYARPTFFFAVPRIWAKMRQGVLRKIPQKRLDILLSVPLVNTFIKRRIRKELGLDKSRRNVSGAAFISQELKDWFGRLDIPISEAYAMTENGAVGHMLFAENARPGSAGQTLPGTSCKIVPETGEVLVKSTNTMVGYYKNPDKTAETIVDGWLHTGDKGHIDEDGFLYLTGRVKDTFKTAKGEFIVPQPIEEKFAGLTDIEQFCLLGLGQDQPVMLATLSDLGKERPPAELRKELEQRLKKVNTQLSGYERIASLVVVDNDFTIENGLLTPTLKVKRNSVNLAYQDRLPKWSQLRGEVVFE